MTNFDNTNETNGINEENALQTLFYKNKGVRIVWEGELPYWILKDACGVLDLSHPHKVAKRLDEDERIIIPVIDSMGRTQETIAVSESGLYKVIMLSRKPEAKEFKRWITHEVLPSIRKHGVYFTKEKAKESLNNPDMLISLLNTIKEKDAAIEKLQDEIEENKPKIAFSDALTMSKCAIPIGDFAKILQSIGIDIGPNHLFERLREAGLLIKRKGTDRNSPTQKAMKLELFSVNESMTLHPDGGITLSRSTKITPKGQQYLVNLFLDKGKRKKKGAPNSANQMCFNFFILS
jgi:anti-repressor protein